MKRKLSKKYLAVLEQWAKKNLSSDFKKGIKKITLLICPYCGQVTNVFRAEQGPVLKIEVEGEKDCKDCMAVRILEPTIFAWIGRVLGFQQIQKGK